MHLVHEPDEGYYTIRRITPDSIQIGDRLFHASLLLTPERCIEHFPVRTLAELDSNGVEAILALQPHVVLVGTGVRQHLPSPALLAAFLSRGTGFESMDSAAAARTFNLLASEGRRVVAAFLLDSKAETPV